MKTHQKNTKSTQSKNKAVIGAAGVAACLGINSTGVLAQDTQVNVLEEIIVTATRRSENIMDVPSSISVLDNERSIRSGLTDINALADFVPGLTAADGGSPSLGALVIRGAYAGGASTTGIYIDDVPYGPVISGFGSSLALDASLLELDHIEVIRGPQGTLYGASSMGGTVRYVTKQPTLEEIDGHITLDYSDTDKGGNNTLVRGSVSVPVIADTLAIRLSAFSEDADGFSDLPLLGAEDVNEHEFEGYSIGALFQNDSLSVRVNYSSQQADYGDPGYEGFDPNTGQPLLGEFTDITSMPTFREYDFEVASLTLEYDFGWAMLKSVTSDQTVEFDNVTDLTAQFGPLADALTAAAPGTHIVGFASPFSDDRFTQELHLTSKDDDSMEWIVGLYYTSTESDEEQNTLETPADIMLLRANLPTEYDELAAFGNLTYFINEDWDVTFGLRFSDYEVKSNAVQEGVLVAGAPAPSGNIDEDTVTNFSINTRYRLSENTNFYASAATGFRPGGANLVLELGGQIFGEPSFEPDELISYEIGVKGLLRSGSLAYEIGAYYVDWDKAQLSGTDPLTGIGTRSNTSDSINLSGIEAALSGEIVNQLFVTASIALSDNEINSDEPLIGALSGEEVAGISDTTAALSAEYRFDIAGNESYVGASWRYSGKYNSTYNGGIGGNGQPISNGLGNFQNDAYDQIDLRAGIEIQNFTIGLYATNITNEEAYQAVFPVAAGYQQGVLLRPRTIGANLRFNF